MTAPFDLERLRQLDPDNPEDREEFARAWESTSGAITLWSQTFTETIKPAFEALTLHIGMLNEALGPPENWLYDAPLFENEDDSDAMDWRADTDPPSL
jgi:hypothetical protein